MTTESDNSLSLTYGERCRLIDIRARLDEDRAKVNEAQAAYDALLTEARQIADTVTVRLIAEWQTRPEAWRKSPDAKDVFDMIGIWFRVNESRQPHEKWIGHLPVSVVDGRTRRWPTHPIRRCDRCIWSNRPEATDERRGSPK